MTSSEFWFGGDVPLVAVVFIIVLMVVSCMIGFWPPRVVAHYE